MITDRCSQSFTTMSKVRVSGQLQIKFHLCIKLNKLRVSAGRETTESKKIFNPRPEKLFTKGIRHELRQSGSVNLFLKINYI